MDIRLMKAQAQLSAAFKEKLIHGGIKELVGKSLVVKLVANNKLEVQVLMMRTAASSISALRNCALGTR
jgi:hypothetical protein